MQIDLIPLAFFVAILIALVSILAKLNRLQLTVNRLTRKLLQDTPIPDGYESCDCDEQGFCWDCEGKAVKKELLYNRETDRYFHRHCLP